jgi:hypothetical protein
MLVAAAMAPICAQAQSVAEEAWRPVFESKAIVILADQSRIERNGNEASIWAIEAPPGSGSLGYGLLHDRFDCVKAADSPISMSFYSADGKVVSTDTKPSEMQSLPKQSPAYAVMSAACHGAFAAPDAFASKEAALKFARQIMASASDRPAE